MFKSITWNIPNANFKVYNKLIIQGSVLSNIESMGIHVTADIYLMWHLRLVLL